MKRWNVTVGQGVFFLSILLLSQLDPAQAVGAQAPAKPQGPAPGPANVAFVGGLITQLVGAGTNVDDFFGSHFLDLHRLCEAHPQSSVWPRFVSNASVLGLIRAAQANLGAAPAPKPTQLERRAGEDVALEWLGVMADRLMASSRNQRIRTPHMYHAYLTAARLGRGPRAKTTYGVLYRYILTEELQPEFRKLQQSYGSGRLSQRQLESIQNHPITQVLMKLIDHDFMDYASTIGQEAAASQTVAAPSEKTTETKQ